MSKDAEVSERIELKDSMFVDEALAERRVTTAGRYQNAIIGVQLYPGCADGIPASTSGLRGRQ